MIELTIYVPRPGSWIQQIIRPRSGIVGSLDEVNRRIQIDYQDIHGRNSNIQTWEDAVFHAAGRHVTRYPTSSRAWPEDSDLIPVGTFRCQDDWSEKQFLIEDQAALNQWLGS